MKKLIFFIPLILLLTSCLKTIDATDKTSTYKELKLSEYSLVIHYPSEWKGELEYEIKTQGGNEFIQVYNTYFRSLNIEYGGIMFTIFRYDVPITEEDMLNTERFVIGTSYKFICATKDYTLLMGMITDQQADDSSIEDYLKICSELNKIEFVVYTSVR